MRDFLRISFIIAFAACFFTALFLWKPDTSKSAPDRVAWIVFAFGICLMVSMTLYAMSQEIDGDFRSWETIRLHVRLFLALAMIPVAGPLIVYLQQARKPPAKSHGKKALVDDLD